MNNNYNMMQANTNGPEDEKKGFFARLKEKREKKLRQKEALKLQSMPLSQFTNDRKSNVMREGIKSRVVTPEEALEKKWKRNRIIRNILTIPELIIVIFLGMHLKEKYIDYCSNVNQIINYSVGEYIYEIQRDDENIKVSKFLNQECENENCEKNLGNYDINFGETEMFSIRTLFDIYFSFKSGSKSLQSEEIKTSFVKKIFYSIVNNDQSLIFGKAYKGYKEVEFSELSSYTKRGFQLLNQNGNLNLYIAMGEKPSSGYILKTYAGYMNDGDLVIYVTEDMPNASEQVITMISHPLLKILLDSKPKSITVYNVETGEAFDNYESIQQSRFVQNKDGYIKN